MKKHNISQFFRKNGFYVALFVGVVAIAAVSIIGVNVSSRNKKNLVDLNTPSTESAQKNENTTKVAEGKKDAANTKQAANTSSDTKDKAKDEYTNDELLEYDVYGLDKKAEDGKTAQKNQKAQAAQKETAVKSKDSDASKTTSSQSKTEPAKKGTKETADQKDNAKKDESVTVMKPNIAKSGLSFSNNTQMGWPVNGNVIMPYSMEKLIHFATLGEWKVNPAIVISCEKGTKVKASYKGVVTDVSYNEETGNTVKVNVGNGYDVIYGQLADVSCKAGDSIQQGDVIGTIAEPTMYYQVEGSNLYFQVLENGTPVNPMLFLSGEEE